MTDIHTHIDTLTQTYYIITYLRFASQKGEATNNSFEIDISNELLMEYKLVWVKHFTAIWHVFTTNSVVSNDIKYI